MKGRVVKGAAYHQLIAEQQFIALDIETTETKATTAAPSVTYPVSVGVVLFMNDTRRDPQHYMGNPGFPMDKASSAHNGIKTADLLALTQDVPAMLAELDAYLAKYPDAYLVCHNANFDVRHLYAAYERAGMTPFSRNVLDTQFLPKRLKLDGVPTFSKLDNMRIRYNINTTNPAATARLRKGLKDAQDTAELLGWLIAEAADRGIITFPDFVTAAKARASEDIASAYTCRRVPMTRPNISATHIRNLHRGALPAKPASTDLDRWVANAATCVRLHCPHLVEKVTRNDQHATLLLPRLTALLPSCMKPGDLGTLLNALEPLMLLMTRDQARAWYKANVEGIRAGAGCEPAAACPACAADQSCPKDTIYHLVTRRALDYGQTSRHKPVRLLSKQAKKDLWDGESSRKIDTWPRQGMADMAPPTWCGWFSSKLGPGERPPRRRSFSTRLSNGTSTSRTRGSPSNSLGTGRRAPPTTRTSRSSSRPSSRRRRATTGSRSSRSGSMGRTTGPLPPAMQPTRGRFGPGR